MSAIIMVININ